MVTIDDLSLKIEAMASELADIKALVHGIADVVGRLDREKELIMDRYIRLSRNDAEQDADIQRMKRQLDPAIDPKEKT